MEEVGEPIHQVEDLHSTEDAESDQEISGDLRRSAEICGDPCSSRRITYACCGSHLYTTNPKGHPFHRFLSRRGVDGEHFPTFVSVDGETTFGSTCACFLHLLFLEGEVDYRLCNAAAYVQPFLSPHPLHCQYCQCFQYGH